MPPWIDEPLVLVLAREVDQHRAELGQPRRRRQRAVDVGPAAATALDGAAHEHLVGAAVVEGGRQAGAVEDPAHPRREVGRHLEDRLDHRLVGAGARDVGRRPPAAQQVDGLDDERLAGAGLAGEDVEALAQLDGDVGQDGEVGDAEVSEHGRRTPVGAAPAGAPR
ncbi:MAG: hypothetical protein R2939_22430 [Kofleriaceae bacterium]